MLRAVSVLVLLSLWACDDELPGRPRFDGGYARLDAGSVDLGAPEDAAFSYDAGSDEDLGGMEDSGSAPDTGHDSGLGSDGGPSLADASLITDANLSTDASLSTDAEANLDSSSSADAGDPPDSGAGMDVSSFPDAAPLDLGLPGTGDVWIELDYRSAYTPGSPTWRFSNTPGWGAAEWAMEGDTWPEAWDRWNNMTVDSDPIGTSLLIGSSSELQLMIGLEEMLSYQSMTVELEGRSRSTCCSLSFQVTNPLINCGNSGQMSNDWNPDIVQIDLGTCLLVGPDAGIEAVRITPNGTMALQRMRVTLHGAQW